MCFLWRFSVATQPQRSGRAAASAAAAGSGPSPGCDTRAVASVWTGCKRTSLLNTQSDHVLMQRNAFHQGSFMEKKLETVQVLHYVHTLVSNSFRCKSCILQTETFYFTADTFSVVFWIALCPAGLLCCHEEQTLVSRTGMKTSTSYNHVKTVSLCLLIISLALPLLALS